MTSFPSELDFLARETFQLTADKNILEDPFKDPEYFDHTIPEGPGIIYRIEKGVSTFCLKGAAVASLADSYSELPSEIDNVLFFEIESIETAEVIVGELFNRRFPIHEDHLCNISDPGFSWWLDENAEGFSIHFTSYGIDRENKLLKLGPVGDSNIAVKRFGNALPILEKVIGVNEFSCDEKKIVVKVSDSTLFEYQAFKNLFITGSSSFDTSYFESLRGGRTLELYFNELSTTRRFWIEMSQKLELLG